MPQIAIDYTPAFQQGGGIGRLTRELVAALAKLDTQTDYRLFVAGAQSSQVPPAPAANFHWRTTRITNEWFARLWHRARVPFPVEFFTGKVDIYHATDFTLPPTLPQTRTILTVHDLSYVRAPETASPSLKAYLDVVVPRSVKRADHLLADSQSTKNDLIELYQTPEEKITVLLSGVDAHFKVISDTNLRQKTREKYKIPARPYIFAVGTVQPRKNYARLIEALAILRRQNIDVGLVIAGGRGWLEDPIYQSVKTHDVEAYTHLIGFADEHDLPTLYSDAICVATPSIYEGFGLPILEAFACETPVVTANVSSLPEVAGDAALLVDPLDTNALAEALKRLITEENLRKELIAKGLMRVKAFTWQASANHLREIYQQMLL